MKMEELKKRKPTRLKYFDYRTNAAYFVTICTQNRKSILSAIPVGEGSPLPQLTCYGEIVDKWVKELSNEYPEVSVDRYVIMPNHIHLLLSLIKDNGRGDPSPTMFGVVGWLKYRATKDINKINNTQGEKVFQRSFYDHVIRNRDDYEAIVKYIHENPECWYYDELYSEG